MVRWINTSRAGFDERSSGDPSGFLGYLNRSCPHDPLALIPPNVTVTRIARKWEATGPIAKIARVKTTDPLKLQPQTMNDRFGTRVPGVWSIDSEMDQAKL